MKIFKKLIIPFTAISIAALVALSSGVVAEDSQLPSNSVIIGSQAFDLDYVNDPANVAEIQALFVAGDAEIFVKAPNGIWYSNTEERLTPEEVLKLPAVTYKAPDGTKMGIPAGDGAAKEVFKVVSIR
jgi:hypothetical protein